VTTLLAISLATCGALLVAVIQLRRRLQASRAAFDVLTTRTPVGILRADARGMCTFANDAWCELSGLTPRETLGRAWSQAVHPDDLADTIAEWEASVREQRPYSHALRLLRPDGTERHVLAKACPIKDQRGCVTGFIGSVLDITDRLEADRLLRRKDSLLQTLIDHSSAAIYLKDREGRYLLMNRRHLSLWPELTHYRPGTTPYDWFSEQVADSFLATDAEVFRTGETRTFEESIPLSDGLRTFLTAKFPVLDERGEVMAVGGISADISELEAARRSLAERERLLRGLIDVQEAEKRLLCHEFHDGLIQYSVGSKMLLESLQTSDLPAMVKSAVDSVIDFLAKGIDDGRRVIRGIRPAVLDDLGLRAAVDDLVEDVKKSEIAVDFSFDGNIDDLPAALQTTAYRVIQESCNNARRHSGTTSIRIYLLRGADGLGITIEDFGAGFDPAGACKTGFGLLGLRERVRLAEGTCTIDTAPGAGTRVAVHLPLKTPLPEPLAPHP
jgi:PAS domain S-box-containing protein